MKFRLSEKSYNILVFILVGLLIISMWWGIYTVSEWSKQASEYDSMVQEAPAEVQPNLVRQAGKAFGEIKNEFMEGMEDAEAIQEDK